eukprot:10967809-Heterocapsa_arctica.AAC.1
MLNNVGAQQAQAAQAATDARAERARREAGGMVGVMEELKSVVNPKLLEKTPTFWGRNGDFTEWVFTFSSVAGLLGLEDGMRVAVDVATDQE